MEQLFLSDKAYAYLEKFSLAPVLDSAVTEELLNDDSFFTLLQNDLITHSLIDHDRKPDYPSAAKSIYYTTELGMGYLNRHRDKIRELESIKSMAAAAEDQAISAKDQAAAAKTQAEIAVAEAQKANDKSLSAVLKANKSFIVSVIGVLISILANLEKIIYSSKMLLSYLNSLIQGLIHLLQ